MFFFSRPARESEEQKLANWLMLGSVSVGCIISGYLPAGIFLEDPFFDWQLRGWLRFWLEVCAALLTTDDAAFGALSRSNHLLRSTLVVFTDLIVVLLRQLANLRRAVFFSAALSPQLAAAGPGAVVARSECE